MSFVEDKQVHLPRHADLTLCFALSLRYAWACMLGQMYRLSPYLERQLEQSTSREALVERPIRRADHEAIARDAPVGEVVSQS